MTTLVFGSKGFIGQAVLRLYGELGIMNNIIIASRDITYSKYILDRFPMARILDLPIRSGALNLQFRDEIDKVLYLSGVYDLERKDNNIANNDILKKHFDLNVVRLIEELQDCVINFKNLTKVVYASSQAVDISLKTLSTQDIGIENLAYGLNKHLAEKISSYFLNNSFIEFHPLRIGTVYGPGEPAHRFAFQLISSFSRNKPFLVKNSNDKRNYVYVLDLAKYIFKVLETDISRSKNPIYLAGKEIFTIKDYSENLKVAWEAKTGSSADVQYMSPLSTNNLSLMECDNQFISYIPHTSLSLVSEKFVNWFIAGSPNLIVDYL